MSAPVRPQHRLLGAMRDIAAQSERVARAEARVVAARVGEVASASVRRLALAVAAAMLGTLALGFLLVAAYDALSLRMPGWQAALIIAGGTLLVAGACAWAAAAAPSAAATLFGDTDDGEMAE